MKQVILSTVGTSIITNWFRENKKDYYQKYSQYANNKTKEIPPDFMKEFKVIVKEIEDSFLPRDLDSASKLSAEINGIRHIYKNTLTPKGDMHFLICSDTWYGQVTTAIIEKWLISKGTQVQVKKQSDLKTNVSLDLQVALSDLVKWIQESVVPYKKDNYFITFNLAGGFKGVQGFLQSVGMVYADETCYVFEGAPEMMRIPRLPIKLDTERIIDLHLNELRQLSLNIEPTSIHGIADTLYMKIDNQYALTAWGEIIWDDIQAKTYAQQLLPSPHIQIVYADSFLPSLKGLSSDRLRQINIKIDALANFFISKMTKKINSLDFKAFVGDPCPPSTHEIDAWSDQNAKRIFGHFEQDIFVLDSLHKAIHP